MSWPVKPLTCGAVAFPVEKKQLKVLKGESDILEHPFALLLNCPFWSISGPYCNLWSWISTGATGRPYPVIARRRAGPGSPPSLSSASGAPAGAPPPRRFGRFPSWRALCGAACASCRPAVSHGERDDSKLRVAPVGFYQYNGKKDMTTSIPFSSRTADFLFSLLWSCKNTLECEENLSLGTAWKSKRNVWRSLTRHELSSSCEQRRWMDGGYKSWIFFLLWIFLYIIFWLS